MNPCLVHRCHACCLNTEMMLTNDDVERIELLGFRDFYEVRDGFLIMKNINGRCFFLCEDGRCRIYRDRPEGCRTYPFVFDMSTGKVVRDVDCPYSSEFEEPDGVKELAERIIEERAMRIRSGHPSS